MQQRADLNTSLLLNGQTSQDEEHVFTLTEPLPFRQKTFSHRIRHHISSEAPSLADSSFLFRFPSRSWVAAKVRGRYSDPRALNTWEVKTKAMRRQPTSRFVSFHWALALLIGLATTAQGQEATPPTDQAPDAAANTEVALTPEAVQSQIEGIKKAQNIPDDVRAAIIQTYESAAKELQRSADRTRQAEANRQALERAPSDVADLDRRMKELPSDPDEISTTIPLDQLYGQLASFQADIIKARKTIDDLSAKIDRRPKLLAELPQTIATLTDRIEQLRQEMSRPPAGNDAAELVDAKQILLEARLKALEADLAAAESERRIAQNMGTLLAKRREYETRNANLLDKKVAAYSQRINQLEEIQQRELARKALLAAASSDKRIEAVITQNRLIASDYNNTDTFKRRQARIAGRLGEIAELRKKIENDSKRTKERLTIAGPNVAIHSMMRTSKESIPDPRLWIRRTEWANEATSELALRVVEINDGLHSLDNIDAKVNEILGKATGEKTKERQAQEEILRGHLEVQRELYQAAAHAYDKLLDELSEYITSADELIKEITEFKSFLAEQMLWVRSSSPLGSPDIFHMGEGIVDLINPSRWLKTWDVICRDFLKTPAFYLSLMVAAVSVVIARPLIRRRLRRIGEQVSKNYVGTPHLTVTTFCLTVAMAGIVPLSIYLLGRQILRSTETIEVLAVATALQSFAAIIFLIDFLRQACRPSGLATTHFRWRAASVAVLRRNLRWLSLFVLPLALITTVLQADATTPARDAMVRLLFILDMAALSFFLYHTLHHTKGVAESLMGATANSWTVKLRILWFPFAVFLPLTLAVMAGLGYIDSALMLNDRLLMTLALIVGVVAFNSLVLRWLYAVRGQLAINQAKKRREIEATQLENTIDTAPTKETTMDLSLVNAQTRRLQSSLVGVVVLVGLLFIWSDIIPALRALERFTFWSKTEYVWETERDEDTQNTHLVRKETTSPVTLRTFAVVLLIGSVTIAAAKNVPGFLEVTLLTRLPLDAGAKFAITTVARYVISIVGLLACSNELGIQWNSIQWLAAAFTVGLGFGLQEIVANFVSGLILLAERPIRIGDIVTVADLTGTVSHIQMRATTITDSNRKELIVPNKEFITGRVVNWTLTDRILRIIIEVGVSYDADPHKAEQVLLSITRRHPHVLAEPPPKVVFDRFADNMLNFIVYAHVDNVDHASITRHQINMQIKDEFDKAEIGIAFPQREVNVRFLPTDEPTILQHSQGHVVAPTQQRASA